MRILLTNHFPYHGSGTGTYVRDLAGQLIRNGHEVHALIVDRASPSESEDASTPEEPDPCPTTRIWCGGNGYAAALDFDFPCFTAHPKSGNNFSALSDTQVDAYVQANTTAIETVTRGFAPDIIHCQHVWLQASIVRQTSIPYVISAQGTDIMGWEANPRLRRQSEDAAAGAGAIIAASRFIERQVLDIFQVARARVQTLVSAIDPFVYGLDYGDRELILTKLGLPADLGPVVLFLGKFVAFKGVDLLLEAARIYGSSALRIATVLCGDGPLRATLQAAAERMRLERVWFVGDRALRERAALLRIADLLVVPSRAEPLGLVALEAMASGTPVLATRAGGLPEIVDDEVGALVDPDDSQGIARSVLRAITEQWKISKASAAKEKIRSERDLGTWVGKVENIYQKVLGQVR